VALWEFFSRGRNVSSSSFPEVTAIRGVAPVAHQKINLDETFS